MTLVSVPRKSEVASHWYREWLEGAFSRGLACRRELLDAATESINYSLSSGFRLAGRQVQDLVTTRGWESVRHLRLGKRQFELLSERAVVLDAQRWSETRVWSSGGGGYIERGSGIITVPTVHSDVDRRGEVWVRFEDGKEFCLDVGSQLQCRQGQELILVLAVPKGKDHGIYLAALNQATGQFAELHDDYGQLVQRWRIGANPWLLWLGIALTVTIGLPLWYLSSNGMSFVQALRAVIDFAPPADTPTLVGLALGSVGGIFVAYALAIGINTSRIRRLKRHLGKVADVFERGASR